MYVAASTRCFSELTLSEACNQISELGYDKVELWMSEEGNHLKPSEVAADPERTVAQFREASRLTPIAVSIQNDVSPALLEGVTKFAKILRIAQVTIPASPLGAPFNTEIDRLREFQKTSARDGIRLSLKTETGYLTEDPHTAVELCQAVRGLGLTLDPSHYVYGVNRGKSFDQVFPYVYHVHLRDSTATALQVPTGLGEIDYNRLIAQLRRQDYNQMLSVELIPDLTDPESRALEMRKLHLLLESLL